MHFSCSKRYRYKALQYDSPSSSNVKFTQYSGKQASGNKIDSPSALIPLSSIRHSICIEEVVKEAICSSAVAAFDFLGIPCRLKIKSLMSGHADAWLCT